MKAFHWLAGSALVLSAVPLVAASMGSFNPQHLSDTDKFISSDAFEGRGPATRAETKTVAYITDQFKAAGLKPAGDTVNGQRQWTQAVPLLKSEIAGTPQLQLNLGNGQTPI